ncbi:MAG: phosphate transporter permease subunit PstC, partial [Mucilaginibacter sp.]|nr:phosphate transporter permease subunit PstC [Mucilaginibacter sp.]
MKSSIANTDETISTTIQDSLIPNKKQVTIMKNSRLSLSNKQLKWEIIFKRLLIAMSIFLVLIILGVLATLIKESMPSIKLLGIGYLWGKVWDPVSNIYGAYPFLVGTLLTSFIALIISVPFSYAVAIYLGEYNRAGWLSDLLKNTIELIAAVPSIIYGFWGLFVLVPLIRTFEAKIGVAPYGI